MELFYRELGEGSPLIILHGLLGSSDNWLTLAKTYGEHFHVYIPDQRNHGQSFHSDDFDYQLLAADLQHFIEDKGLRNVRLIGHSMGGKVVMQYALQNPDNVERLIVADMSPKDYQVDYDLIFNALNAVDLPLLKSRGEADKIVGQFIAEFGMRQFLLKNLTRQDSGYAWKANLPAIQRHIQNMGKWNEVSNTFPGKTLFIYGSQSGYVKASDRDTIQELFPEVIYQSLEAGHWLHAEKPNEFLTSTLDFLTET